jgi:hypothetical protein
LDGMCLHARLMHANYNLIFPKYYLPPYKCCWHLSFSFFLLQPLFKTFTPPHSLLTSFSPLRNCISTYAQCMQPSLWQTDEFPILSICDTFQDKCEEICSICGTDETHYKISAQNETERCLNKYRNRLDLQKPCQNLSSETTFRDSTEKRSEIA